jgi:hypothetical protein
MRELKTCKGNEWVCQNRALVSRHEVEEDVVEWVWKGPVFGVVRDWIGVLSACIGEGDMRDLFEGEELRLMLFFFKGGGSYSEGGAYVTFLLPSLLCCDMSENASHSTLVVA